MKKLDIIRKIEYNVLYSQVTRDEAMNHQTLLTPEVAIKTDAGLPPKDKAMKLKTIGGKLIGEFSSVEHAVESDAYLEGANLEGARLEGAYLAHAYLARAYLARACLAHANLEGANLEGTNLEGACLARAYLAHANLKGARLAYTNLKGARLAYTNLEGANLADAYLAHANLEGTNLAYANLEGANLAYANLEDAYLDGARGDGRYVKSIHIETYDMVYTAGRLWLGCKVFPLDDVLEGAVGLSFRDHTQQKLFDENVDLIRTIIQRHPARPTCE